MMFIGAGCAVGGYSGADDVAAVSSRSVRKSAAIGGRTQRTSPVPRSAGEARRPRRTRPVRHPVSPTRHSPAFIGTERDHRRRRRRPCGQHRRCAGRC